MWCSKRRRFLSVTLPTAPDGVWKQGRQKLRLAFPFLCFGHIPKTMDSIARRELHSHPERGFSRASIGNAHELIAEKRRKSDAQGSLVLQSVSFQARDGTPKLPVKFRKNTGIRQQNNR
jgi:hypothetical protein